MFEIYFEIYFVIYLLNYYNFIYIFLFFIQASGLAGGKGVLIPATKAEAFDALKEIMVDKVFGSAGKSL